ncbi:MAG: hypothetical protein NT038_09075 [Euryarchaeota archaeon]|nr:hypothetical protein [Euryarchaeota archaeon]
MTKKYKLIVRKSVIAPATVLVICFVLLAPNIIAERLHQTDAPTDVPSIQGEDDWYYLPSYSNYAPAGMPDFDQKQDTSWQSRWGWSFCAPVALADVLWWFDSKHSDPNGTPGDGIDEYPLVSNYNAPGSPEPGPSADDHAFNNVNDDETTWDGTAGSGKEFIERLAWYTNTNFCRSLFFPEISGTTLFNLRRGTTMWLRDAGLQNQYNIEIITKPSFSFINERMRQNQGVLLRLIFSFPSDMNFIPKIAKLAYHYVAVAGISSNGFISVSDPEWDVANPCKDPMLHNNASIVSHDIYQVNFTSPYPHLGSWWIPTYASHRRVVITHAVIISEKE